MVVVAMGESAKGRAALKGLIFVHLVWCRRQCCGNANLQLLPSSTLLGVHRRKQEDKQGDPSVLLPDAKRM